MTSFEKNLESPLLVIQSAEMVRKCTADLTFPFIPEIWNPNSMENFLIADFLKLNIIFISADGFAFYGRTQSQRSAKPAEVELELDDLPLPPTLIDMSSVGVSRVYSIVITFFQFELEFSLRLN